ncbi:MAG: LamG domain-containing protein [Bacteroidota bacterium]|nr:LamG domain-containing protein [Bacteroidota bacterium]
MKKFYSFLVASLFSVMLVSAVPTTGLQFSGVATSYIDLGQQATFSPAQFTVEAWVKFQSLSGAYILSTEGSAAASGGNQGFVLRVTGSKLQLSLGANTEWPNVTSTTDILVNTWYHVAATYSGSEMKLYINGVLDASVIAAAPMVTSVQNVCIGEGSMWKGRLFTGQMADLRFWNVVRAQVDIAADMTSTLTGTEPGLVADWKMNEGSGTFVGDATGVYGFTKPADVAWFIPSVDQEITVNEPTKGLVFDATKANSFVDFGQQAAIASPSEFTVEALVNYNSVSNNYILTSEGAPTGSTAQGFSLRMNGGKIDFTIGANAAWVELTAPSIAALNTWTHVAATYSAAAMKLYVNGLEVASLTNPAPIGISTQNVVMGEGSMWKNRRLDGKLGYVRMWSVAKTKQEIRDYANTYATGTEANLLAAWNNNVENTSALVDITGTYPGVIGSDVQWFGFVAGNADVLNNSDKIEATLCHNTLRVVNKSDSGLHLSVYNITGSKVLEAGLNANSTFERQLKNLNGCFVLKCSTSSGAVYIRKFVLTR